MNQQVHHNKNNNTTSQKATNMLQNMAAAAQSKARKNQTNKKERTTLAERSAKFNPALDKPTTLKELIQKINSGNMTGGVQIYGRDFPPSYVTKHSSGDKVLKENFVVNTFYEEGRAPRQPDPDAAKTLKDASRMDAQWFNNTSSYSIGASVAAIVGPIKHNNYKGYFLALQGTKLPQSGSNKWSLGAGMYPTDLLPDNHIYREIWQSYHTQLRPKMPTSSESTIPAIGVFLHVGQRYTFKLGGRDTSIEVAE